MNIIKNQANEFFRIRYSKNEQYEKFIQKVRTQLYEYKKDSHKLEFIEHIIVLVKQGYDEHLKYVNI